ncbi:MAG: hypothetical protein U9N45_01940 [Gemmatimonadota bacterium]|nr:hypothetical protein [Gemmatimonadota bacterium]
MRLFVLTALLVGFPLFTQAETVKLPVTEDTGISSVRGCMDDNSGASVTVPIRQNQNWSGFETKAYLMKFDAGPILGMTVDRAILNVFLAKGELYAVGLCTVLADWEEGQGLNGQTGRGGASWNLAREPEEGGGPDAGNYWSWPGSGIYSVSWAHPDARYHHVGPGEFEKIPLENGIIHLRIPVAPELVQALAAGLASGLILTDDKGQVAESYSLKGSGKPYRYDMSQDTYLYTRDIQEPLLRPFLEVQGRKIDNIPPGAVDPLEVVSVEPFEQSVTVSLTVPAGDGATGGGAMGYEVRCSRVEKEDESWENAARLPCWAVPQPEAPGAKQLLRVFTLEPGDYSLAVRAVDKAGNRGPVSWCRITVPEVPQARMEAAPALKDSRPGPPPVFENSLELWACSDLCKVDPVSGGILLNRENYRPAGDFRLANRVWSGRDRTVSLEAMKGEVVAFQLVLGRVGDAELTGIRVVPGNLKGPVGMLKADVNISTFRTWYLDVAPREEELTGPWELVEKKDHKPAWHGDACLPLAAPFDTDFDLPAMDNMGPQQRYQSVWVDLFVPRQTKPGIYRGEVSITADRLEGPALVGVKLRVLPLVMPGHVGWVVDLNTYNYGVTSLSGLSPESDYERFITVERRLYQMAHRHRATLNILPYGQDGTVQTGCAPTLKGSGRETRIDSWKQWDRRFSPYLSGKAFTPGQGYRGGPGIGVPVTHFYLPFHENWPMPIENHYDDWADLYTRVQFGEWAKSSRPLEEAFDRDYQEGFVAVAQRFFEHLKKKKFTKTGFQAYFNNKYYFKVPFFAMPAEGRGSSFWLLDEPVDYDDFAANRFFLSMVREGYERARAHEVKLHLRTDVSQPEMSRGLWDGLCNLWTTGGLFPFGGTASFRMKRIPGEQYWEYGGGPSVSGCLLDLQALFLSRWSIGASGQLPYWDTLRQEGWFKPSNLAIFFTGTDYARSGRTYDGPIAGVRLKAMRRAQQDIEYLDMLAAKPGWSRMKVTRALAAWADDPEARAPTFNRLTAESLFELRKAVVKALLSE